MKEWLYFILMTFLIAVFSERMVRKQRLTTYATYFHLQKLMQQPQQLTIQPVAETHGTQKIQRLDRAIVKEKGS